MSQRVAAIDDVLEIQSSPSEGTDVAVRVPKSNRDPVGNRK